MLWMQTRALALLVQLYANRVLPWFRTFPPVAIVPDGAGKGTAESQNGKKAAEYLKTVESLVVPGPPFSWVLIRPPLATDCVCCKACVCHKMKLHCTTSSPEVRVCVCACVDVCIYVCVYVVQQHLLHVM